MEKRFASFLSYIFHPLLLPSYSYFLMLNQDSYISLLVPPKLKWGIILFVLLISAVIPFLINYILLKRGLIRSFLMETRQERLLPFLITAICFYLTAHMAKTLGIPGVFYLFSLGITLLALMALFMTFYVKVSIHMIGIGGMTATFIALSIRWHIELLFIILCLLLVSGLTGYARLKLKSHTPAEVYSGYITGFGVMLLLLLLI